MIFRWRLKKARRWCASARRSSGGEPNCKQEWREIELTCARSLLVVVDNHDGDDYLCRSILSAGHPEMDERQPVCQNPLSPDAHHRADGAPAALAICRADVAL